jgi:hypothetical protein
MMKTWLSLGALASAVTLGACTHETQRDTLTGAMAGTAVGIAQAAVTDDDIVEGMARGAAIGGGLGLARGMIENAIAGPRDYDDGYGYDDDYGYGYGQAGLGYQDPYYSDPYYGDPYGAAPGYRSPSPYYRQQVGYPDPYSSRGYRY